jgi:hypothetical protein
VLCANRAHRIGGALRGERKSGTLFWEEKINGSEWQRAFSAASGCRRRSEKPHPAHSCLTRRRRTTPACPAPGSGGSRGSRAAANVSSPFDGRPRTRPADRIPRNRGNLKSRRVDRLVRDNRHRCIAFLGLDAGGNRTSILRPTCAVPARSDRLVKLILSMADIVSEGTSTLPAASITLISSIAGASSCKARSRN